VNLFQRKTVMLVLVLCLLAVGTSSCTSVVINNPTNVNPSRSIRKISVGAGWIYSLAWSTDNATLAVGSRDNNLSLWNTVIGTRESAFLDYPSSVSHVAWSPNSKYLATGSQGLGDNIRIWNVTKHQLSFHVTPPGNYVSGVAWSSDNHKLAVGLDGGSEPGAINGMLIYDPFGNENPIMVKEAFPVTVVAWEPAGMRFAFGVSPFSLDPGIIRVGKLSDKDSTVEITQELLGHSSTITDIAWSPDDKLLASISMDKTVKVWNAANGKVVTTLQYGNDPKSIAWSPDSKRLAVGGWAEPKIKVWDVSTGQVAVTLNDPDSVNTIAWSPDGTRLASGDLSGIVWIWDMK